MRLAKSLLVAAALAASPFAFSDYAWKGNGTPTPGGGDGVITLTGVDWEYGYTLDQTGSYYYNYYYDSSLASDWPAAWQPLPFSSHRALDSLSGQTLYFGGSGGNVTLSSAAAGTVSSSTDFVIGSGEYVFSPEAGSKFLSSGRYSVAPDAKVTINNPSGAISVNAHAAWVEVFDNSDPAKPNAPYFTFKYTSTGTVMPVPRLTRRIAYLSDDPTRDLSKGFVTTVERISSDSQTGVSTTRRYLFGQDDSGGPLSRGRIFLNVTDSATMTGALSGAGVITKTGQGTLQVASGSYYYGTDYFSGLLVIEEGGMRFTSRLADELSLFSPSVLVKTANGVEIKGVGRGAPLLFGENSLQAVTNNNGFKIDEERRSYGAAAVVLKGNASLSFQSTPENWWGNDGSLNYGSGYRYNGVRNLQSDGGTELQVGLDDNYRVSLLSESGIDSSVGKLSGKGRFYKTGSGSLTFKNDATFSGEIFLTNGDTKLAGSNGVTIYSAASVNLGFGTHGDKADNVISLKSGDKSETLHTWYFSSGASLTLGEKDESIRDLQALFFEKSERLFTINDGKLRGADVESPYEGVLAGTGDGTRINLGSHKLTVVQTRDGYYSGSIIGGAGSVLIKEGPAALALVGEASSFETLVIRDGRIIANVQGLGSGNIDLSSTAGAGAGKLEIVQTTTGTLFAHLSADALTTLSIKTASTLNNGSVVRVGDGGSGVVKVKYVQPDFKGTLEIQDGINLQLAADGGYTFPNANRILFTNTLGSAGRETTIAFNDTDQVLPALEDATVGTDPGSPSKSFARIELGKGNITLKPNADFSYAGEVSGLGALILDASPNAGGEAKVATFTGNVSYSGATVLKQGRLNAAKTGLFLNSGALVVGADGVFSIVADSNVVAPDITNQTFGALYGSGSVLLAKNTTLTVGRPASAEDAARAATLADPGVQTYFATDVADPLWSRTRSFLSDPGRGGLSATLTDAELLAFRGVIGGEGGLIKSGAPNSILTLSQRQTYSGATQVKAGTLAIVADGINASSGVELFSGSTLSLDAGASATPAAPLEFNPVVKGAAGATGYSVRKTGIGVVQVSPSKSFASFGGSFDIAQGTLRFVHADKTAPATLSASATGSGLLEKTGGGTLNFTGDSSAFAGSVSVSGGRFAMIGFTNGAVEIADGATYAVAPTADATYSGVVSGAGTFEISGARVVSFASVSDSFVGRLSGVSGVTLRAAAPDFMKNVVLSLSGATFDGSAAPGPGVSFVGVNGDASSRLLLGASSFATTGDANTVFSGTISGSGVFTKSGSGTQSLRTSAPNLGWTGSIIVAQGVLEAAPTALGSASVRVKSGATLSLYNDDPLTAARLAGNPVIESGGILAKSGVGEVRLVAGRDGVGAVSVSQGRLSVVEQGVGSDFVFANTTVSLGATYQVNMAGDRKHDSGSASYVTGAGNLAVSGAHTLTLAGAQGYTGNTELLDGAVLRFADSGMMLNGLAGDSSALVILPDTLTIRQNVAGDYAGFLDISGNTSLTVTGFDGQSVSANRKLTISSGDVQVNSLSVVNGGWLDISTGGLDVRTSLTLSGGAVLHILGDLLGDGTLNVSSGARLELDGVDLGTGALVVDHATVGLGLITGTTRTVQLNNAILDADVASGTTKLVNRIDVSGVSTLSKSGGGVLQISDRALSFSGNLDIRSGTLRISGDMTVAGLNGAAAGTLSVDDARVLLVSGAASGSLVKTGAGTLRVEQASVLDGILVKQGVATFDRAVSITPSGSVVVSGGLLALRGAGNALNDVSISGGGMTVSGASTARTLSGSAASGLRLDSSLSLVGDADCVFAGVISGTGALSKRGLGTLTLSGDSSGYGGDITVAAGTLKVFGDIGSGKLVVNNATVDFAGVGATDNSISGAGGVLVSGKQVFSANNTYFGTTTIAAGASLTVGVGADRGALGSGDVKNSGALVFNRMDSVTIANAIIGDGSVEQAGSGSVTLTGVVSGIKGAVSASNGRLLISEDSMPSGRFAATGSGALVFVGTGKSVSIASEISGNGRVEFVGAGDTTLSGSAYAFSGDLEIGAKHRLLLGSKDAGSVHPASLSSARMTVAVGGELRGSGSFLTLVNNGTLSPGYSPGLIVIANAGSGDFHTGGTLNMEVDGYDPAKAYSLVGSAGDYQAGGAGGVGGYDQVRFDGTAYLGGTLNVSFKDGVVIPAGALIPLLVDTVTGDGKNSFQGNFVKVNASAGSGRVIVTGGSLVYFAGETLTDTKGLVLHDGVSAFTSALSPQSDTPVVHPDFVRFATLPSLAAKEVALRNSSPVGLAALTALPISQITEESDELRRRAESQLLSGNTIYGDTADILTYVSGKGGFLDNDAGRSSPSFDTRSFGGAVGVERRLGEDGGLAVGVRLGYDRGSATLHDGGGKIDQDHARATLYGIAMLGESVYLSGGFGMGYSAYQTRRNTLTGVQKASPTGWDLSGALDVGAMLRVNREWVIAPHAGLGFVSANVGGFTEKGSDLALAVDGYSQNSVYTRVGVGLFHEWGGRNLNRDTVRIGMDVAYEHELLDDKVAIPASFATFPQVGQFTTDAPASGADRLVIGPQVQWLLDESRSISAGYRAQIGFDGAIGHRLDVSFEKRF